MSDETIEEAIKCVSDDHDFLDNDNERERERERESVVGHRRGPICLGPMAGASESPFESYGSMR